MGKELSIFRDASVPAFRPSGGELSPLMQSVQRNSTFRRIKLNNNGTFTRMVGKEKIGKAVRDSFNAIIIGFLPGISRTYYTGKWDPEAPPQLPDCWSNLGDRPEEAAENPQAKTCAACPKNVKGSAERGGRACNFERRVALLLEGDQSGDIYQMKIPSQSLFGEGENYTQPFERYLTLLATNKYNIDNVVTEISFDEDSEVAKLFFTPSRSITAEEYELVSKAQGSPDVERYISLTVAHADGATSAKPAKQAVVEEEEGEDVVFEVPAKPSKAPQMEPVATKPRHEKKAGGFAFNEDAAEEDDEEEEEPQPKKRVSRKTTTPTTAKKDALSQLDRWAEEADKEEEDA